MYHPEFYLLFGQEARSERQRLGLSQEAVAVAIFGNGKENQKNVISEIENAKRRANEPNILAFAKAVEIPIERITELNAIAKLTPSNNDFPFKSFGNIKIPITNIFGNSEKPKTIDDILIRYVERNYIESESFPKDLRPSFSHLSNLYLEELKDAALLKNNPLPRLDRFSQEGEDMNDEPGRFVLYLSQTDFLTFCATNRSSEKHAFREGDELLKVRDRLAKNARVLDESLMANAFGVHTAVISISEHQVPKAQLAILKRGPSGYIYPNFFQSAAGFCSLAHRDQDGNPSIFHTAISECSDEIGKVLESTNVRDVKLTGLYMNWEDLGLNFCTYLTTEITVDELVNSTQEHAFEGLRYFIPWNPDSIVEHIVQNDWEPAGACNVLLALESLFGREEVEKVAQKSIGKSWFSFMESNRIKKVS